MAGDRQRIPVSVVIPCYRCADSIERAVASVAGQTKLPRQLILVEDCSDDDGRTLEALERLRARHADVLDVAVIPLAANAGAGEARNAGWNHASQDYVAFLDADDSWHPEKLEIQHGWMETHSQYALSCHQTARFSGDVGRSYAGDRVTAADVDRHAMLFTNMIPTRSVMLRKRVTHRFPAGVRFAEDYFLWLQILFDGGRCAKIPLPLAFSYKSEFGGSGLSANLTRMHRGVLECYQQLLRQKRISRLLYALAAAFEVIKHARRRALVAFRTAAASKRHAG